MLIITQLFLFSAMKKVYFFVHFNGTTMVMYVRNDKNHRFQANENKQKKCGANVKSIMIHFWQTVFKTFKKKLNAKNGRKAFVLLLFLCQIRTLKRN